MFVTTTQQRTNKACFQGIQDCQLAQQSDAKFPFARKPRCLDARVDVEPGADRRSGSFRSSREHQPLFFRLQPSPSSQPDLPQSKIFAGRRESPGGRRHQFSSHHRPDDGVRKIGPTSQDVPFLEKVRPVQKVPDSKFPRKFF